ncbi:hypothetical protein EJ04DRAFT_507936 [Polyplosphaeria fusca]|uniref:Zn(2)-C6 fungal-type domain-containing protein n=1 Tax=Polyplosphaeria fusca TaxID=682080 RepID=A0A9P4R703_9PLEO|nr:hypothetical protein EJ04DRAFT_507936 [Polyplosphaeria fusca]
MAVDRGSASILSQQLSSQEDWQDLVFWDGELYDNYDPRYQRDTSLTGSVAEEYYKPESVVSEHNYYVPSAPLSIVDGQSSFEYTTSAAPSVVDGPSSTGHTNSWFSASPSFSTAATSPLASRNERARRPVLDPNEYDLSPLNTTSPISQFATAEEILPGSFNSHQSFHTASPQASFFNPFISSSPHAFNSLDVSSSQAIANIGGWAEYPQIIEPISELDHAGAIPIPQPNAPSYANSFSSYTSDDPPQEPTRPRAITIPQPHQRGSSYIEHHSARATHRVPPLLSVSPDTRNRPRSAALARSSSGRIQRRHRNSLATPSPTSNTYGWVSYQPNHQGNKLVPLGIDGSKGKRQKGRTRGLNPDQRKNAALMRVLKACSNCKRRKERCDPGIPCKSCLEHYKGDLVHNPCRDRLLVDLSKSFLSKRLGWHPTARPLASFMDANLFNVSVGMTYTIPLKLGFGPEICLPVHILQVEGSSIFEFGGELLSNESGVVESGEFPLCHTHVMYSWPPSSSTGELHRHAVLPAVLTADAQATLSDQLDNHLSLLVTHHFRQFPLYCSPLRILREVYVFFRSLDAASTHARLLHQALKLLVLVHIGGDVALPQPSADPVLAEFIGICMPLSTTATTPTPCFIRSQFGSVMPALALRLMQDVLSNLEQLFLNRECAEWPLALAVLIIVLMTVESIHYHAAKLPFHHSYDPVPARDRQTRDADMEIDEQGIKALFNFYSACFSGCHARLRPSWEGEVARKESANLGMGLEAEDQFVESVREAVRKASPGGYLSKRAHGEREGEDMEFFFDRLVARLLLLKTG